MEDTAQGKLDSSHSEVDGDKLHIKKDCIQNRKQETTSNLDCGWHLSIVRKPLICPLQGLLKLDVHIRS